MASTTSDGSMILTRLFAAAGLVTVDGVRVWLTEAGQTLGDELVRAGGRSLLAGVLVGRGYSVEPPSMATVPSESTGEMRPKTLPSGSSR